MAQIHLPPLNIVDFGAPKERIAKPYLQENELEELKKGSLVQNGPASHFLQPAIAPSPIQAPDDRLALSAHSLPAMQAGDSLTTAQPKIADFADYSPAPKSPAPKTVRTLAQWPTQPAVYFHPAQFALALEKTTRNLQEIRITQAASALQAAERKYNQIGKDYIQLWHSVANEEKKKQTLATANKGLQLFSALGFATSSLSQALSSAPAARPAAIFNFLTTGVQYFNLMNNWNELARPIARLLKLEQHQTTLTVKKIANLASLLLSLAAFSSLQPHIGSQALASTIASASNKLTTTFALLGMMAEAKTEHRVLQLQATLKEKASGRKRQEEELNSKTSVFGSLMRFTKQIFERAQKLIQQSTIKVN